MTIISHVRLLITRDETTTLYVDVPAYELPMLEAPYPDGAVQEVEAYDVEIDEFDASAEYERLVAKFAGHAATDAARLRRFERARDLAAWVDERQPKADSNGKGAGKKEAAA